MSLLSWLSFEIVQNANKLRNDLNFFSLSFNCRQWNIFVPTLQTSAILVCSLVVVHLAVVELNVHLGGEDEAVLLLLLLTLLLLLGGRSLDRLRLSRRRFGLLFAVGRVVVCKMSED